MTNPGGPERISPEQIYAGVRTRIAFEQLLMSVLYGSLVSAGTIFVLKIVFDGLISGAGFGALLNILFESIYYAFIVFLGGFLSAVVVGVPLFELLEKRKIRKSWPYFLAAFLVSVIFYSLVFGKAPVFIDLPIVTSLSLLLPGFFIATLFAQRMRPIWRQAEQAEQASVPTVVRIH